MLESTSSTPAAVARLSALPRRCASPHPLWGGLCVDDALLQIALRRGDTDARGTLSGNTWRASTHLGQRSAVRAAWGNRPFICANCTMHEANDSGAPCIYLEPLVGRRWPRRRPRGCRLGVDPARLGDISYYIYSSRKIQNHQKLLIFFERYS